MKYILNSRISTKLIIVGVAICLSFSLILGWIYFSYKDSMYKGKYEKTKEVVETAWGIMDYYVNEAKIGNMTEEEAQTKAKQAVNVLRYNKDEYFWISDMSGTWIMHPISPELEGTNYIDEEDANGKKFIKEMIEICKENAEGFVDYYWPKPGSDEPVPKISYAKLVNEWDWFIASGIYVDDVEAQMQKISTLFIIISILVLIFILGLFLLIIRKIVSKPIEKLVEVSEKLAIGDVDIDIDNSVDKNTKDEIQILTSSMYKMTENIKEQAKIAQRIASGDFRAQTDPKCDKDILSISMNTVIKTLKNLVHHIELTEDCAVSGNLDNNANTDEFDGNYKDIVNGINNIINTLVGHIDSVPLPVLIMDKELDVVYINKTGADLLGLPKKEIYGSKCYDVCKTSDCDTDKCGPSIAMKEDRVITRETDAHPNGLELEILYTATPIKDKNDNIIGALEVIVDQTEIKKNQRISEKQAQFSHREVENLTENLKKLAQGNLDLDLKPSKWDEDTKLVANEFNTIKENLDKSISSIKEYITDITYVLTNMANSNMDIEITREYKGNFITIKESLNHILTSFNKVLGEINNSADQVAAGVKQLSDGNQELSTGTTEQASSIEQLNASISEIAAQTKQNSENAQNANNLTDVVVGDANNSKIYMDKMLASMEKINDASMNISKIIKVIDEIAFQTNILSLNAAVEAARAGEHGKGFAVVAEEVRNLAAKSAEAAKETTALIESSANQVKEGSQNANDTASTLNKIISAVSQASELIKNIAISSKEQELGINQINEGIDQVSIVVQKNSANAEQSAAASEELSGQAEMLKSMVSKFKLKDNYTYLMETDFENINLNSKEKNINEISFEENNFGKY